MLLIHRLLPVRRVETNRRCWQGCKSYPVDVDGVVDGVVVVAVKARDDVAKNDNVIAPNEKSVAIILSFVRSFDFVVVGYFMLLFLFEESLVQDANKGSVILDGRKKIRKPKISVLLHSTSTSS